MSRVRQRSVTHKTTPLLQGPPTRKIGSLGSEGSLSSDSAQSPGQTSADLKVLARFLQIVQFRARFRRCGSFLHDSGSNRFCCFRPMAIFLPHLAICGKILDWIALWISGQSLAQFAFSCHSYRLRSSGGILADFAVSGRIPADSAGFRQDFTILCTKLSGGAAQKACVLHGHNPSRWWPTMG